MEGCERGCGSQWFSRDLKWAASARQPYLGVGRDGSLSCPKLGGWVWGLGTGLVLLCPCGGLEMGRFPPSPRFVATRRRSGPTLSESAYPTRSRDRGSLARSGLDWMFARRVCFSLGRDPILATIVPSRSSWIPRRRGDDRRCQMSCWYGLSSYCCRVFTAWGISNEAVTGSYANGLEKFQKRCRL